MAVGILPLNLCFSRSLLQFQPIFASFVAISAVLNVAVLRPCHLSELLTLTEPHIMYTLHIKKKF